MKWLIASDIHGSAFYCKKLLGAYDREQADRLLLLGDILYHGPRNDLPKEYVPKAVSALLNARKQDILCVWGNCDSEVDQMMLEFPILAEYAVIDAGERLIYASHGHRWNEQTPLPLKKGDLLLCGHTHIPACHVHQDFTYLNPGSVSIPKENSYHGYMTFEKGCFIWKDLDGNIKNKYFLE